MAEYPQNKRLELIGLIHGGGGKDYVTAEETYNKVLDLLAAPDMYEALKLFKLWNGNPQILLNEIVPEIDKALAKAEGK